MLPKAPVIWGGYGFSAELLSVLKFWLDGLGRLLTTLLAFTFKETMVSAPRVEVSGEAFLDRQFPA